MAGIFKNEVFPQLEFAYYWPPIWFLLLVLSRKSKAYSCSLTCLQTQGSTFCFEKFCTDPAPSIGMPTFFCGVLTTKWGFFCFVLWGFFWAGGFVIKPVWNSVLNKTDWKVRIKNSELSIFVQHWHNLPSAQSASTLLSWSNVSVLPKPSRSSLISPSIHKVPLHSLCHEILRILQWIFLYGFVKCICATNGPKNTPGSIENVVQCPKGNMTCNKLFIWHCTYYCVQFCH